MNLILAYIQSRFRTLSTIRKKGTFVGYIHECRNKGNENITFEQEIQAIRTETKKDKRTITIQDFGAGSKKLSNERSISAIYKTSVASLKFQRMLFQIVSQFECKNILEMGTSLGFSAVYLSKASLGKVTTVEACPAIYNEATQLFDKMQLKNVTAIHSTFVNYFEKENSEPYDLVYIDGHHDGTALLSYVEILKPRLSQKAILVIDDIRWSKGMQEAWSTLINDADFKSNVDLFRMGILEF